MVLVRLSEWKWTETSSCETAMTAAHTSASTGRRRDDFASTRTPLDYAVLFQTSNLIGFHAEVFGVHLRIMLPEERSRFDLNRRVFELHGTSGHRELAAHRMLHRHD